MSFLVDNVCEVEEVGLRGSVRDLPYGSLECFWEGCVFQGL